MKTIINKIVTCNCEMDGVEIEWIATIESYAKCGTYREAVVTGYGSKLRFIIGFDAAVYFICVPDYEYGSYLAHPTDVFWNVETMSRTLGKIDATTIAMSLKLLHESLELQECGRVGNYHYDSIDMSIEEFGKQASNAFDESTLQFEINISEYQRDLEYYADHPIHTG